MNPPEQSSIRNRLLALLSGNDYALLQPHLEFRDLPRNTILLDPNQAQEYVYFIESGLASQIANGDGKRKLEVGIYGRDAWVPRRRSSASIALPISTSCKWEARAIAYLR